MAQTPLDGFPADAADQNEAVISHFIANIGPLRTEMLQGQLSDFRFPAARLAAWTETEPLATEPLVRVEQAPALGLAPTVAQPPLLLLHASGPHFAAQRHG
ncbi:MAG: hypothetical protein JWS10_1058 [Cypionkella sp.]|nr:hypothetical protein [Cypionkella sp.]